MDNNNQPRIHNGEKSGLAADHWNRYPEDIKLMNELGVNHYRFSIEWSKIEPELGSFSLEAIKHYRDKCDSLFKKQDHPGSHTTSFHPSHMV